MDRHAETGAETQYGAGIGGDIGLVKGKTDHGAFTIAALPGGGERAISGI
jgi:hypothetical protein